MPELQQILIAALTGFLSGLLLSIPIGPVNLTIINEGARRGEPPSTCDRCWTRIAMPLCSS